MTAYDSGGPGFGYPRLTRAVKVLLLINAGVFVLNAIFVGRMAKLLGVSIANLFDWFGLGLGRLLTYQFVHALDPFHLLFNALVLYFFGTMVEERIGARRLYWLYLLSGLVGGVLFLGLAAVTGGRPIPLVGASGACYGIMTYAAFVAPRTRVIFIIFPIELRWLVGGLVAIGVYQTYLELVLGVRGEVAHAAHLGGALWGFLAFRYRDAVEQLVGRVEQTVERRQEKSRHERQVEMDRLLEKVHQEGLSSLTPAERKFLDKASAELRRK